MKRKLLFFLFILFASLKVAGQNIALYEQFNGNYDFTFFGNTLNLNENGTGQPCIISTSSSANLSLAPNDVVLHAYLYWAGSGTGDFNVSLNGQAITAQRTFPLFNPSTGLNYFSAFADVTTYVQNTGNGLYTLSGLDLTEVISTIPGYCNNATNFGGWAVIVIYENASLPLNQLNLYDGMQFVPNQINISLNNLNVIDNNNAKIGFLAWEGDEFIAVNESLKINGITLSSLPLNPATNAFNGTNTITNSNTLFNMDLDIYDIENLIQIGDETAEIQLTSGQDFVMVNAVVTKLNSQLPDATIAVTDLDMLCNSRVVQADYIVSNTNSTDPLPAATPIAFYVNGDLVATSQTASAIPIGGSQNGTITFNVPLNVPPDFELLVVVDDTGAGTGGIVTETDETNNTYMMQVSLPVSPPLQEPADITECDSGNGTAIFDFSAYLTTLKDEPTDIVTFYTSAGNANSNISSIDNPVAFNGTNGQEIYVRLQNVQGCFSVSSFTLLTQLCPDATVVIGNVVTPCNLKTIQVAYTINNFNSFSPLPANVPVAIYANGMLITTFVTTQAIPVEGSISGTINLIIPDTIPLTFNLTFVVDDSGNGTAVFPELIEDNNTYAVIVTFPVSPPLQDPADITACDIGNGTGVFDFSGYLSSLKNEPTDIVTFHTSLTDAQNDANPITNNAGYPSLANGQEIFVRLENEKGCFTIGSFLLLLEDCLFPDGTIIINSIGQQCNSRILQINYTVNNFDAQDILPAGTPIAIYANGTFIDSAATTADIAINSTETGTLTITVPAAIPNDFTLMFAIDDSGNTIGIVTEIDETNNTFSLPVHLAASPVLQQPQNITSCDTGKGTGTFDFSAYETSLKSDPTDVVTFYISQNQAEEGINRITDTAAFDSAVNPQEIFVRLENQDGCYTIGSFMLIAVDCRFPDATVSIGQITSNCNSRTIQVTFTVNNFNSFDVLPGGTPISIYANGEFIEYTETILPLPIGASETETLTLAIPDNVPLSFELNFVVDDAGNGTGIVVEIDETNNSNTAQYSLTVSPQLQGIENIISCNEGMGMGTFDFSGYEELLKNNPSDVVSFYLSAEDAQQGTNPIINTLQFVSESNPQEIFVRLFDGTCYSTGSFLLLTKNCPPETYNYVTPNGDGINDTFFVKGLRDIFTNFKMSIYNRWGNLVWEGDHSKNDWDGIASVQKIGPQDNEVPTGTYYFVLELNDPDYPDPIVGWVYVTK